MAHDAPALDLLTPDEHALAGLLDDAGRRFGELLTASDDAPQAEADWHVIRGHLLALRALVLGNAAARAYPASYRLLGRPAPDRAAPAPPEALLGVPGPGELIVAGRPDPLERTEHDPELVSYPAGDVHLGCSCGREDGAERLVWTRTEQGQAFLAEHLVDHGWGQVPAEDAVAALAMGAASDDPS